MSAQFAAALRMAREWLCRPAVSVALFVVGALMGGAPAEAQTPYWLYTGHSNAQTQIDTSHTSSWYIVVTSGTLQFAGGNFDMKLGSATVADVTLTLYQGGPGGTVLGSKTLTPASFTNQFTPTSFAFASTVSLGTGTYFAALTSPASTSGAAQYFIKGYDNTLNAVPGSLSQTDYGVSPPSNAGVTTNTISPNFSLSKSATSSVSASGAITYTINLGNDGGSASGTSATVKDVLPTGVVATAVTKGTNVSTLSCGTLPSAAGATLTCNVGLTAAMNGGTANGGASFTITATAPATSGSITNYASVDPTGA